MIAPTNIGVTLSSGLLNWIYQARCVCVSSLISMTCPGLLLVLRCMTGPVTCVLYWDRIETGFN